MESKHATTSVGMWGLFVIAAAQIANQLFGTSVTAEEQKIFVDAYGQAIQAYTNAATVLGAIMAILGRRNATKPVHFMRPFAIDAHGQKIPLAEPVTLKVPEPPADVAAVMAATPAPNPSDGVRLVSIGTLGAGLAIVMLALTLSACSTLPRVVGAETAQSIERRTLQSARASLKVWKIAQAAIVTYGSWPYCDPQIPDLVVCRGRESWKKVKAIDRATSTFIEQRRALVLAGTDDVAFLVEITQAVSDAQLALDAARGKE